MSESTATTSHVTLRCPFCLTLNRVDLGAEGRPVCGKCKKPILVDRPVRVEGEDFEKLIADAEIPVLVDFYADWCGPCKMMAPAYEQAAGQLEPRVRLAKLNTEVAQQTAGRFAIRSIPTIVLFDHGREISRQSGAMNLPQLVQWIEGHIK